MAHKYLAKLDREGTAYTVSVGWMTSSIGWSKRHYSVLHHDEIGIVLAAKEDDKADAVFYPWYMIRLAVHEDS